MPVRFARPPRPGIAHPDVTVIVLTTLLAATAVLAAALAVVAHRRGARMRMSEGAVMALARSWSEDGSSRGRLCASVKLVAGAEGVFLAEVARRGDALHITAAAGVPELIGVEAELDADRSAMARALVLGKPLHLGRTDELPAGARDVLAKARIRSAHLRPVFHGDRPAGVLGIAWRHERAAPEGMQEELIAELAAEAARAIERDAHVALLARQARTDELTALPNRRAWDEAVEQEMARAERTGEPLCLALLDLDHFKAFNDQHGHQAGDAHLRRTAAAWRRELRAIDVLARYGGEEFGVLLPSCDITEAGEVIDRVRRATPNGESASAGVVAYDGRESADSLLARADAALYRAKHAGRGMTVPA
jgi:diguanylate cyclase (GGDEF)-like protein